VPGATLDNPSGGFAMREERAMEAHDDILDRDDVERIAHEVIGKQFRLPALFSVVLLIIGFVLGHYVASRHVKDVTDRLEARIAKLDAAVAEVEKSNTIAVAENPFESAGATTRRSDSNSDELSAGWPPHGSDAVGQELSPEPPAIVPSRSTSPFRLSTLSSMSMEPAAGGLTRDSLQEAVTRLQREAADERTRCLSELAPHLEQRSRIPAVTVSAVVEDLFSAQERRLSRLVDEASGASAVALHDLASTFRSDEDRSERMFPPLPSPIAIGDETTPVKSRSAPRSRDLAGNRYFSAPDKVIGGYFFTPSKKGSGQRPTSETSAEAASPFRH
jgi:hypothetical protein